MLLEIGLIWWFIEFEKSHEWQQRPLEFDIVGAGKKHENIRHDHGFIPMDQIVVILIMGYVQIRKKI